MRLMRVGPRGAETPALLDGNGIIRDLSGHVSDIAGEVLSDAGLAALRALDPARLPEIDPETRVGPCAGGIGKLLCIGLNFADHAAEAKMDLPEEPLLFGKAITSVAGPDDDLVYPAGATQLDYEVELALVIGTRAKNVSEDEAMRHVAGYALFNDVSERAWQRYRSGQFVKGKSHDGFGPLGPWLVTRDEIDTADLRMVTRVNGKVRQDGSTATMVFGPARIVSYLSQFVTLMPGDVIPTGTPPGVAMGMEPPAWLVPGDVMDLSIEGLGQQRQRVVAA